MRALILGASGLVGGNCQKYFTLEGWEVLGTHFSFETTDTQKFNTLDLNDPENADITSFNPEVIVHCGALTWVDYCEEHVEESFEKTVVSAQNAVRLAKQFEARLVYLSTDYVFDGKQGYYSESDEPNPISVYGKHKLEAERYIQAHCAEYTIGRITNVYGREIRGKNFIVRLINNLQKEAALSLTLPIDQYATPVNAWDVARALKLLVEGKHNGIFNLASTDTYNRVQLARKVFDYYGRPDDKIVATTTEALNQAAPRPLLGGFNMTKFNNLFPNFKWSNVDDFLKELKQEE